MTPLETQNTLEVIVKDDRSDDEGGWQPATKILVFRGVPLLCSNKRVVSLVMAMEFSL